MRYKRYLTEAIMDVIQKDIDMLWEPVRKQSQKIAKAFDEKGPLRIKVIKRIIKDILSLKSTKIGGVNIWYKPKSVFSSDDLKSPLAKLAHEINPVTIISGFVAGSFQYRPEDSLIIVGLPIKALAKIGTIKRAEEMRESDYIHMLKNILSYYDIRSMIRHELTHWLDDTFHGRHLLNKSRAGKLEGDAHAGSKFELQAIIHQVHQLKKDLHRTKEYEKEEEVIPWDKMDFDDLADAIPDLGYAIYSGIVDAKELLKRMWRENLLTPKMVKSLQKNVKRNIK